MDLSLIIPALNEEKSIGRVIDGIKSNLENSGIRYEIIVVDSSTDRTGEIAREKGAIVIRAEKRGKGYAMIFGAEKSKGKTILFMDADGVNDPSYLREMYEEAKNYDIVMVGPNPSHFAKGVSLHDKAIFVLYYSISTFLYRLAGMNFNIDPLTGYRAMRKEIWRKLKLSSHDFLIESEMNIKARDMGLSIKQIVCEFLQREGGLGKSKLATNPSQILKIALFILRSSFKKTDF